MTSQVSLLLLTLAPSAFAVGAETRDSSEDGLASDWAPTPRIRFGAAGLLGGNGFYTGGIPYTGLLFGPGQNGAGGIGVSLHVGVQWDELMSLEVEAAGDFGFAEEARGSLLLSFTPVDWFSVGVGPSFGANFASECTSTFSLFGPAPPSTCGNYSAGYGAAELRIDFLPGVGLREFARTRRSFDIGIEALAGAALVGVPAGAQAQSVGLYLMLGYLQY
jgi:hypothetical protein